MSRAVLGLYHNQGKTIRDIAKVVRMSFRDIGAILKKADEAQEKKEQQQDNDDNVSDKKNCQQQEQQLSLAIYCK